MSNALWKGLVGLLSVVLMYVLYYLYKGVRYLIKNPGTIKYLLDSLKEWIIASWKNLFPERKKDSTTDIDKSPVASTTIPIPQCVKKGLRYLLCFVCIIGVGVGIFFLIDRVIVPYHNTKLDEKLIEQAKKDPSIADKNAIALYNRFGHYCNILHGYQEFKLLELGARNGNVMAQLYLGIMYESNYVVKYGDGYGVERHSHIDWPNTSRRVYHTKRVDKKNQSEIKMLEHAAYWFKMASDAGNMEARGRLGMCYLLGNGVEYQPVAGERLIKEAADSGLAQFQFIYGNLLEKGLTGFYVIDYEEKYLRGEPQIALAKKYWELAANQGYEEATLKLEKLY